MTLNGDDIAEVVQKEFDRLPRKRKPQARGDGVQEWVPLSGIVAQGLNGVRCIALGTGMKCLPSGKIPLALGAVLHDWHAEMIALRALNHFLLEECRALAFSPMQSSEYIRPRTGAEITATHFQPFALKEDIKLHLYCSEAPCGDASMEITMSMQEDPTPWDLPPPLPDVQIPPDGSDTATLHGRSFFSSLGIVRRKPSRPDAPPTLSKSCSDKLAHAQCTSVLSSPSSLLISPSNLYIQTLTLPISQYSSIACDRAFSASGRMAPFAESKATASWKTWGYQFRPFQILTTSKEFRFSRRVAHPLGTSSAPIPSNLAAAWNPRGEETIIGGVLQGRKQFDPRGASMLCRKRMWSLALAVAGTVGVEAVVRALDVGRYSLVKTGTLLGGRRAVKDEVREKGLKPWVQNEGDDGWGLDTEGSRNTS